ncbi:MAG: DUF1802 family protein [Leptolyngbyaceae cyanobacterium T60_A2020_046]|nr:DUF1802 family protein [Leptolyngbyaceae cyanobacterium T60_A2020_046]
MEDAPWALKEWSIAIEALLAGDFILLLRKGGIHERGEQFWVANNRALLFPTVEHQQPYWLKEPYRDRVLASPGDANPNSAMITIPGWAEITEVLPVASPAAAAALLPHHIWTAEWLRDRMAWKPERPLVALLLRAHRFHVPVTLPREPRYGGCRSWIQLDKAAIAALPASEPALSDDAYRDRVIAIETTLTAVA